MPVLINAVNTVSMNSDKILSQADVVYNVGTTVDDILNGNFGDIPNDLVYTAESIFTDRFITATRGNKKSNYKVELDIDEVYDAGPGMKRLYSSDSTKSIDNFFDVGMGTKRIDGLNDPDPYAILKQRGITPTLSDAEISAAKAVDLKMQNAGVGNQGTGNKTGTVWDGIKGTQPEIPGTNIPKSFVLECVEARGKELWVHPNATKHIAEYSKFKEFSHLKNMNEQSMLTSFKAAVQETVPLLKEEGRNFLTVGGWELGIDKSSGVIYHALPVGK